MCVQGRGCEAKVSAACIHWTSELSSPEPPGPQTPRLWGAGRRDGGEGSAWKEQEDHLPGPTHTPTRPRWKEGAEPGGSARRGPRPCCRFRQVIRLVWGRCPPGSPENLRQEPTRRPPGQLSWRAWREEPLGKTWMGAPPPLHPGTHGAGGGGDALASS
uniref:Uncharacterized protein n=1 Tax=Molossus molossus TaxID=27622 RepID=A0A7J8EEF9_MOLMO|nr:hypothetical protein HJG59_008817 [Molossus molossus]